MRNVNDILYGLTRAYEFFEPAILFIYSQLNEFLFNIEQRWYLMFAWLLLNAGFCFWVVGRSLFDWSDILTDGLVRGALLSRAKANRLEEAEERYQRRKAENRAEAEARYLERKQEREEERRLREEARYKVIGDSDFSISGDHLAFAYFQEFPDKMSFHYQGKTYYNAKNLGAMTQLGDYFGDYTKTDDDDDE